MIRGALLLVAACGRIDESPMPPRLVIDAR